MSSDLDATTAGSPANNDAANNSNAASATNNAEEVDATQASGASPDDGAAPSEVDASSSDLADGENKQALENDESASPNGIADAQQFMHPGAYHPHHPGNGYPGLSPQQLQQMQQAQMMHGGGGFAEMDEYDQANVLAALANNQMMMTQQQRAEQDSINAQAAAAAGGAMPLAANGVEICRAYLAGRCSRGAACRFVHVENTTGHQPPNPHLCRDWLNGTCIRGTACRFQHQGVSGSKASIHSGPMKTGPWSVKNVICHQWASRGRCDYGTACKFSHQRVDRWNESALDEKKLLAAMLSGLSPQEALSQALNTIQNNNPHKFGGTVAQVAAATGAPPGVPPPAAGNDPNSPPGVDPSNPAASPAGMPNTINGLPPGMLGLPPHLAGLPPGGTLVPPQKRADGSLILCRFFARHGYCKYGVACKFHHAPLVPGMFPGPMPHHFGRDPNMGGNQSLAQLLALGLKASMMSNDHLIANHAALLAASMGGQGGRGMNGMGMPTPPIDPSLANALAAYLQGQPQHNMTSQNPNMNIAALLGQLQGGGPNGSNPNSISPTQLGAFDGSAFNGNGGDPAFQAFLQHQQAAAAQANAFNNAFSPAAASAFNAIPNLNSSSSSTNAGTPPAGATGSSAAGTAANSAGTSGNGGLSLPQMISTAFRSSSNGASSGSTSNSSLSNNLSLMNLKPFDADSTFTDTVGGVHNRSNSNSFSDGQTSYSSPSLLANEQRFSEFGLSQQSTSTTSAIGPSSLNGTPSSSTLSALFSSSLSGPFLH